MYFVDVLFFFLECVIRTVKLCSADDSVFRNTYCADCKYD